MTTVAEAKKELEDNLKGAPNLVAAMRLKVVEAVQLADELKALTDQGLSNPYDVFAQYYGKQRAILRGLSASDIISFDLPDTLVWNQTTDFTFPSVTQFGYVFVDLDGNDAAIDDPSLYYLTKHKTDNVLSTLEDDAGAYAVPTVLKDGFVNLDQFQATWEQVNFTLSTKTYYGITLKLINIAAGVLDEAPKLLKTMWLRKKADHTVVGTVQIVCEGLEANPAWNHLTGATEDCTLLSHSSFRALLGYLDPVEATDVHKSADPFNTSTGRKDGSSYPDIEKNPCFPATDGSYTGSAVFKGNFVHSEEGVAKWAVHSDIKWQYGTAPASLGSTSQNNPGTMLAALNAIDSFASANPTTIPADIGNASTAGKSYEMVGDYVYEFEWTEDPENPLAFIKGDGTEYACYFNDVQHMVDDHLNHLLSQLDKISTLGNTTNTIDTDRQSGDTQFIADSSNYRSSLSTFLSYHSSFDPITSRPTYNTAKITTLKSATSPGYLEEFNARVSDLGVVLGTPESSGYSKIIYDTVNAAVNKDIGYMRAVVDSYSSIEDVYGIIERDQTKYEMYP